MVYILDYDKDVCWGFQKLLKSAGYQSVAFSNLEDFLKSWKPKNSDLLILEIHMPGMNSYSLLDCLRKRESSLPIIVVTAFDDKEDRESSKRHGVLAFLRKPVDGEALIDLVQFAISPA